MRRSRPDDEAVDHRHPEDLRTLLARYRACPAHSKPPSFLAFVRLRNPHVLSHHEHDRADYLDHVLRIGGLYICRGCATVILAVPPAFGIAMLTRWPVGVPTAVTASIFVALLLVALLPLRDGRRTILHDLRRAALGCLMGSAAAYVLLTDDWLHRAGVVGVYLAVLLGRRIVRRRGGQGRPQAHR